jgi:hypothetical protein
LHLPIDNVRNGRSTEGLKLAFRESRRRPVTGSAHGVELDCGSGYWLLAAAHKSVEGRAAVERMGWFVEQSRLSTTQAVLVGTIDEGNFVKDRWISGRRLNGDEGHPSLSPMQWAAC